MSHLASTLRSMVVDGDISKDELRSWRKDAVTKLATNSGQTIRNASAHGVSFTAAGRMTWDTWASLLSTVLNSLERNTKLSAKSSARF